MKEKIKGIIRAKELKKKELNENWSCVVTHKMCPMCGQGLKLKFFSSKAKCKKCNYGIASNGFGKLYEW